MTHLFSVHNVAFSFVGYDMSWLELGCTVLNLWSVWLMARHKILTWPVGNVAVVLSFLLFWQIQLYDDVVEQIYYFVTGFWGWWLWSKGGGATDLTIRRNTGRETLGALGLTAVLSVLAGWATGNLNAWLPALFPKPASLPYLDAATTVASFTAQILMVRQRLECWWFWIVIDFVGIGLYAYKGVLLMSGLYAVFLVLAIGGLITWTRKLRVAASEIALLPNAALLPDAPPVG